MATFKGKIKLHGHRPGGRSQESRNNEQKLSQKDRNTMHRAEEMVKARGRNDSPRSVHHCPRRG